MRILYIGDIMAGPGVETVEKVLPGLVKDKKIDLVIAQAENVSEGRGITVKDFRRLQKSGVDFCTGGNWTLYHKETVQLLEDPAEPIIRPANYPAGTPGLGYKLIKDVLVISLLGKVVGRDADLAMQNPLQIVDAILHDNKATHVVVNLHGDYSSEKVIIGHYLDGRATLVVGDHWHVPTADARILPKGTAHITDVGMVGTLNSSLGIAWDSVIPRWRDGTSTKNVIEDQGPKQFNAVLVKSNEQGLSNSIEQIRILI